ncbi:probable folate-biopterin transporter 7 isoform X2 [Vigna umbellata]|uniref:probable folate-biopterin transporter 7 isoform X2 n=1 Tax=Vigna umbellata TaxID=87088 RepID=UPI001F5F609C|nr:probable folate-biopterin transporter 7 isoform X2 [Vigna umbellata]
MVTSDGGDGGKLRKVLGLGYWVQGFRCFPWLVVSFYLKDGLNVDPSTLQILQNSANLPMVGKPLYGLVSDSVYISGQHRVPYIAFGAFLQALSWIIIAISPSNISIFTISIYLLLSNLGASIAEVANDAIVAEMAKQSPSSTKHRQPSSSGNLQSFVWIVGSAGGVLGTMFFYQTQHLKINSSVLGISKVFGQATMLLWGIIYNQYFKSVPPRKLISAIQATMAFFMISDFLFVRGFYRQMGVPDSVYVVIFSGFLEVLFFFKILPFSVLIAQMCPPGCEGSIMAFLMSSIALAFIVSGYLGVALASYIKITGSDFSGFPHALLIQAACTMVPTFWSSCIPDKVESKAKRKDS